MSDLEFARYEANVQQVARRKDFFLDPATSPRRFVCSTDWSHAFVGTPGMTLEQIEAALRLYPDVWPWSGERRGRDD